MKIIFLGLLYSENSMNEAGKYSKRGLQMAPHTFQSTLLGGMNQLEGIDVSVFNIPPVGSFPINYKRPFIKKEKWGEDSTQIGYLNLPIIKWSIQRKKLVKLLEKEILNNASSEVLFVMYSPYIPFLEAINKLKQKYPHIKSCLIVTDCIPGRGDMERYMTASAKKRGDKIIKLAKGIDRFAFLTKHLAEALEIGEKPYVITECICNEAQAICEENEFSRNICLYTGTVIEEFNICELVDAFSMMSNAELWICGKGSAQEYVEKMAEEHENIKYLGFLKQEELDEYRNKCDFLINPRKPTGTYTKYSFPSKTAEYMMSGKPVIMYKLEGIPNEYDQYLNYISGDTPEEIKKDIEAVFSLSYGELTDKARLGREFMRLNKNSRKQAEKIVFGLDNK